MKHEKSSMYLTAAKWQRVFRFCMGSYLPPVASCLAHMSGSVASELWTAGYICALSDLLLAYLWIGFC